MGVALHRRNPAAFDVDHLVGHGGEGGVMGDYRRHDIGFVFQFYNLVQNLTALENVELAAQICRS